MLFLPDRNIIFLENINTTQMSPICGQVGTKVSLVHLINSNNVFIDVDILNNEYTPTIIKTGQ